MTAPKKKAATKPKATEVAVLEPAETMPAPVSTQSVHPGTWIQQVIQTGQQVDLAQLQGMFELQKQYDDELARRAYNAAKARFVAECPVVRHNKKTSFAGKSGDTTSYTYANLAGEMEQIKPHLREYGLHPSWKLSETESGRLKVTCCLTHELGYQEETWLTAERMSGRGNTGMNDLQAAKSTIEYLRRITMESLLGIATDDGDDDGLAGGGERTETNGKPAYPDDQFHTNKQSWAESIIAGKATPEQIISMISTKYELTHAQTIEIKTLGGK